MSCKMAVLSVTLLCASACGKKYEIAFCQDGHTDRDSVTVFGLDRRYVGGSDVGAIYDLTENEVSRGFLYPFPLMLPTKTIANMPSNWNIGDYTFSLRRTDDPAGDIVIIDTTPPLIDAPGMAVPATSVTYSYSKGVQSIKMARVLRNFVDRQNRRELRSCGSQSLMRIE